MTNGLKNPTFWTDGPWGCTDRDDGMSCEPTLSADGEGGVLRVLVLLRDEHKVVAVEMSGAEMDQEDQVGEFCVRNWTVPHLLRACTALATGWELPAPSVETVQRLLTLTE